MIIEDGNNSFQNILSETVLQVFGSGREHIDLDTKSPDTSGEAR